jgi:hypothetical protein
MPPSSPPHTGYHNEDNHSNEPLRPRTAPDSNLRAVLIFSGFSSNAEHPNALVADGAQLLHVSYNLTNETNFLERERFAGLNSHFITARHR